jgi:hypothetical protein
MTSPSLCSPRSKEDFSSLRYNGALVRSKLRSIPFSPLPSADEPKAHPPAHLDGRAGWRCRDWPALAGDRHQPIELLLAGRALLNDADGIYGPNWYNARLLLELKRHDERSVRPTSA